MPAPDSGDNFVGICPPDEGTRFLVMLFDETVDGSLQIDDGVEHAVFQAPPGEFCKETFDSIEP